MTAAGDRAAAARDGRAAAAVARPVAASPSNALRVLAVATLAGTFALVALGSTVRVTESGMGCPGWPLCYGQIGPIDHLHSLLEQVHRYLAALVTIGACATALAAWRSRPQRAMRPALAAVGIVAVQVVLGAVTVITHNAPVTVALHLATGLLLLASTAVTAVACSGPSRSRAARALRPGRLGAAAVVATFVLIVSGSIVVDGGASASCPSWPWCVPHGHVADALVVIVLVHRAAALVATALVATLALGTLARRRERSPTAVGLAWVLLGLCASEVAAGAVTAVLAAPPAAQDVHLALAAALWVCVVGSVALTSYGAAAVGPAAVGG